MQIKVLKFIVEGYSLYFLSLSSHLMNEQIIKIAIRNFLLEVLSIVLILIRTHTQRVVVV
jgi:hypothetical protein